MVDDRTGIAVFESAGNLEGGHAQGLSKSRQQQRMTMSMSAERGLSSEVTPNGKAAEYLMTAEELRMVTTVSEFNQNTPTDNHK